MDLSHGVDVLVFHGCAWGQRDLALISRLPNCLLMKEFKGGKSWLTWEAASAVPSSWR
jgi:hypothetical protein